MVGLDVRLESPFVLLLGEYPHFLVAGGHGSRIVGGAVADDNLFRQRRLRRFNGPLKRPQMRVWHRFKTSEPTPESGIGSLVLIDESLAGQAEKLWPPAARAPSPFGFLNTKPRPMTSSLKSDLHAVQVKRAAAIDENADALALELFVAVARLLLDEVEDVAEARTTAALDADAEPRLVAGQVLLGDDALDFLGGRLRKGLRRPL